MRDHCFPCPNYFINMEIPIQIQVILSSIEELRKYTFVLEYVELSQNYILEETIKK